MALLLTMTAILTTALSGAAQLRRVSMDRLVSTINYEHIRAGYLAETGIVKYIISGVTSTTKTQGCTLWVSEVPNAVVSTAICGAARATRVGYFDVADTSPLPKHCLDTHGVDNIHSKNCITKGGGSLWMKHI